MCYEIAHSACSRNDCDYCLTQLGSAGKGKKGIGMTYVNTYTQQDGAHGSCTGCSFAPSTQTSREYNEQVPAYSVSNFPNGPEWQYLARQFQTARQSGATIIDLDNVDAYSRDVVTKMYDLAGSAGLKVLAKNVFDPQLLQHGAVAGALYEPDGNVASHVQKIAQAVQASGKTNFPVYVIEHDETASKQAAEAMAKAGLNGGATWSGGSAYNTTAGVVSVGNGGMYTADGKFASIQNPNQYFAGLGNGTYTGNAVGNPSTLGGLYSSIGGASAGNNSLLGKILQGLGITPAPTTTAAKPSSTSSSPTTSIPVLGTLLGTNAANTSPAITNPSGNASVTCTTERVVWNCTGDATAARIITDTNTTVSTQNNPAGDIFTTLPAGRVLTLTCLYNSKVLNEDTCTVSAALTSAPAYTDPQYVYGTDTRVIHKKIRACDVGTTTLSI
jgi:hypothetical protein